MSLSVNVTNLATRVATESKSLRTMINGNTLDLSALTTVTKVSLLAAVNEIAGAVAGAGASINDAGTSTSSVWSSSKTSSSISAAAAALVASSPATLDTLNELAAALANDPNFATTMTNALALKAPLASPAFTGNPTGITKAHVGLSLVDNTSDATKPVSAAQAAANALKANTASPTFTGTVNGITATMVGLSNVNNTADSAKPISTAQAAVNTAQATNNASFALASDMGSGATDFVTTFNAGLV